MSTQDELMSQRYGRNPNRARRGRLGATVLAGALLVGFFTWAIVVNFFSANPFSFSTDGYQIENATHSTVRFTVTRDPSVSGMCELRALNQSFTVVGSRWFQIRPGGNRIQSFEAGINTTELPVSLLLQNCRVK